MRVTIPLLHRFARTEALSDPNYVVCGSQTHEQLAKEHHARSLAYHVTILRVWYCYVSTYDHRYRYQCGFASISLTHNSDKLSGP